MSAHNADYVRLAECRADVWNALAPLVREYGTVKLGGILREWLRIDRPPDAEPTPTDLVRQLREVLGMFAGAMSVTPQAAWEEALQRVEQLKEGMCWVCQQKEPHGVPTVVGADLKGNPVPERIIPLSAPHVGPNATGGNV